MTKERKNEEGIMTRESPRARVLRWLERAIASGEIARGAELPPEREIAKRLGVAPNTAAAAMDEAEVRGLAIRRRAGARKRYAGSIRHPSSTARTAARPGSMVCVLAPLVEFTNIDRVPNWADAFLATEVVRRVSVAGRPVSLFNSNLLPKGGLDEVFDLNPGGMVVTGSVNGDAFAMMALARCREAGIPAVAYGNAPELRDYDRAYSDHRAGSHDLTRWLIAHGRKRIVPFFPSTPTQFWAKERIAGYEEAMREARLTPHPIAVFGSPAVAHGREGENRRVNAALAVAALTALRLEDGEYPDALFTIHDDWARPILDAILSLRLDPRRDIVVAGYDNMVGAYGFDDPAEAKPVVTIDKRNDLMAKELTDLLLARMDGKLPPEPQLRLHAHEVVEVKQ